MAGTATADLAAAISMAGGFGMIGGTSRGGPDWLRSQLRAVRAKTSRAFGVGFISSFPGIDALVQVALEERVAAINHSFADPTPYVELERFAQQLRDLARGPPLAGLDFTDRFNRTADQPRDLLLGQIERFSPTPHPAIECHDIFFHYRNLSLDDYALGAEVVEACTAFCTTNPIVLREQPCYCSTHRKGKFAH